MDFVVVHAVNETAATQVFGPFATKDVAYEWAIEARKSRGFAENHETVGMDYLTWESGGMKLDWHILPFMRVAEDSFQHPLGVPLLANVSDNDLDLVDQGGFVYGRIYDWKAPPTAKLVKHITGKTIEEHICRQLDFDHVGSLTMQRFLNGETDLNADLVKMAMDFTQMCHSLDQRDDSIPEKAMRSREKALNALSDVAHQMAGFAEGSKALPTDLLIEAREALRAYWKA